MSDTPRTPAESRAETAAAVRTAAWGLAIYTATRFIAIALASASMASSVAQAIAAEWGAGRLGVTWSDAHAPPPSSGRMARRAAIGAGVGAVAAAVVLVFGWATRAALIERTQGSLSWSLVAVGLVTAALDAMRDELVLHGVTLRALVSVESPIARSLACGVTSAAAALGDPTSTIATALAAFAFGTLLGTLWVRDRGAWMAWGAHAAWRFVIGTLFGGALTELRVASSSWGGGNAGIVGGTAAVVALAPIAIVALSLVRRVGSKPRDGG